MNRSDPLRLSDHLGHMAEVICRIQQYVEDMTEPTFRLDVKTQDTVVRNFEILGEAAR